MALLPGTRLGPYEIIAALGAGGMGEVYRARDTTLGRDVAIKALPASVGADPERVTRFQREAHLLAALNHPHIATIHGIVEAQGSTFIILELVEGESLAQRLQHRPIPVPEALVIARQVADALQAAHMKGIIHRDLKPGNVMLTPEGRVKVLDFGLAKAVDPSDAASATYVPNSPTFTSPATQMGMILGTVAYMAPEQAKGKPVDKRADVWAFGCLFYEMLTGRRPFEGEDVTDTIAAVMRGEPDWSALPPGLSPVVERYLRRCLEKQPHDRVQDIGDMRLALDGAFDVPAAPPAAPGVASGWPTWKVTAAALALASVAAASTWLLKPPPPNRPGPTRRFTFMPGPDAMGVASTNRDLAITPDGSAIIYIAGEGAGRQVYVRRLDALTATPLRSAGRMFEPVVSPDGRWVAFNDEADYTLRKMSLLGGPPVTVAPIGSEMLGATWGGDDSIVYATTAGLFRVPPGGGAPALLAAPDRSRGEFGYAWPEYLPGGKAILFAITSGARYNDSAVAALDLETRKITVIVRGGTNPRYSGTGHLLYVAEGALRAAPFDPARLQLRGDPVPLIDGLLAKGSGGADFVLGTDGTLAYLTAGAITAQRRLVWVNRDGTRQPLRAPPRAYSAARISPDGTRVALEIRDQQADVWIWDVVRETLRRLTTDPAFDGLPVWTRDGLRICFVSTRGGPPSILVQAADGTGEPRRLFESRNADNPMSITPDGTRLIFRRDGGVQAGNGYDLMIVRIDGGGPPVPLLATPANEQNGEVSPDGRWLAYDSDESGSPEVYVRPFPGLNGRWQVSDAGGGQPAWSADGRELFYVGRDGHLLGVRVSAGAAFQQGAPKEIINSPIFAAFPQRSYDVSPDGRRFLVVEPIAAREGPSPSITVVLNFADELKRIK